MDEKSPTVMSIMDAARFHNIKCIALQHGSIHNLHPAYIHSKGDLRRNVYPDLTLVWGQYWSNFLLSNANYPENKVLITGQQRTDSIPAFLQNIETIKRILGFEDKKIILFASQPQQDKALRYHAAFDVFTAALDYPNLLFVVKLHPNELNDSDYYCHIANEVGCKNFIIDSTSDLYAVLAISEIVITCFSTVGSEALYFKKPVIILDHLKTDLLGLIKQNLALRATNSQELSSAISSLEKGENVISNIAADEFIHQYAYKIDGCVSDRILSIIREVNNLN
jgi:CDP-glycerol glycerophosphotransferase (TagB/SpsB family)